MDWCYGEAGTTFSKSSVYPTRKQIALTTYYWRVKQSDCGHILSIWFTHSGGGQLSADWNLLFCVTAMQGWPVDQPLIFQRTFYHGKVKQCIFKVFPRFKIFLFTWLWADVNRCVWEGHSFINNPLLACEETISSFYFWKVRPVGEVCFVVLPGYYFHHYTRTIL